MALIPIDITLRDIPDSAAVEATIRKKAEKLGLFYDKIEFCKVVVDIPQKHKHQGKLYSTHIEVAVPGKRLIVNHKKNQDLYVNIRDAFAAIQRQVEEYAHRQHGQVKHHLIPLSGQIDRLFADYGFIRTYDGLEYYFHKTNVLHPSFEELKVGHIVHFLESSAGDTLQASHVSINVQVLLEDEEPFK